MTNSQPVALAADSLGFAFFAWFRLKFPEADSCRGIGCYVDGCSTIYKWNRRFTP